MGLILLLAVLFFTWPLVIHINTHIPCGSEPPTLCLFQLFTMEWNGRFLDGRVSHYWNAPFFYPYPGTFAWSEPQPLSGMLFWMLTKTGLGSATAYNLIVLLYVFLAGLTTCQLAKQLTKDPWAVFLAGLWMSCGSFMLHQFGALHLAAVCFPAMVILFLCRLSRPWRASVLFFAGLAYICTWLTCAQYALFLTLLAPVAVVSLFSLNTVTRKQWAMSAVVMVAIMALLAPFLWSQHQRLVQMGFYRTPADIRGNFFLPDLFLPAKGHWLMGRLMGFDQRTDVYSWNIGVVFILLLLVGALVGFWREIKRDPARWRLFRTHALLAVTALVLGFGPRLGITVSGTRYGPYNFLASVVPGLDGVRSPARLAVFVTLGVGLLAAVSFAYLRSRIQSEKARRVFGLLVVLLLMAEAWTMPIALADTRTPLPGYTQAVEWLKARADGEPVLELPLAASGMPADLVNEVRAMRGGLQHGHPVINGYSGYFPENFWQLSYATRTDFEHVGLRYIQASQVRYVLVEGKAFPKEDLALLSEASVDSHRFDDDIMVFELPERADSPPLDIPGGSKLRQPPMEGMIVRVKMPKPLSQARLFLASPSVLHKVQWMDVPKERWEERVFEIQGGVLLDQGEDSIYVQLTDLPLFSRKGKSRLVSRERVQKILNETPSGSRHSM